VGKAWFVQGLGDKPLTEIEKRKLRHIRISLEKDVETDVGTGLQDVSLIHRCLPELDLEKVDTRVKLFGKIISAPLIISAITGGTEEAEKINSVLASVAGDLNIGICVGSQRIAVEQPKLSKTFSIVRKKAQNALVLANMGCPQIAKGWSVKEAEACVKMIDADALTIHMNPLQEAVQIGGDTNYEGILNSIQDLSKSIKTPIVAKETGAGISYEDATLLDYAGVAGFEVSGVGGTSWSAVEHYIAKEEGKSDQERLGAGLWNWGIPSSVSVVEVRKASGKVIIASGGIRSGADAAKCIALGADAIGIAKPLLDSAVKGRNVLLNHIEGIIRELKVVMFLSGVGSVEKMKTVPVVVMGRTGEWLRVRGFKPEEYAIR
jgi:isopentenyl-diphosphate delta-isomerase